MNEGFRVEGNTIHFPDKGIVFRYPIEEYLVFAQAIIIRLHLPDPRAHPEAKVGSAKYSEICRNVYGISREGEILWRVESGESFLADDPIVGMNREGENVGLVSWGGVLLIKDVRTGETISAKLVR